MHCISLKSIGTRVKSGFVIFAWVFLFDAVSVQTEGSESLLKYGSENPENLMYCNWIQLFPCRQIYTS